jgi:2-polyprenyl-3-methyl-5-hydroxy-6-metoxy-1,4-benzoquinol methylase
MIKNIKVFSCLICNNNELQYISGFDILPRVTSDCRVFGFGGKLAICLNCSLVQKIPDDIWLNEINSIYRNYKAYDIADGNEQLVLDSSTNSIRNRSDVLIDFLSIKKHLNDNLQVLDIGCGHGVTLRSMSNVFPNWDLFGHEQDESKLDQLINIKNFRKLFSGDLNQIDIKFDFISMIHSLEHFIDPLKTLKIIKNLINLNGYIFIEVCNIEENPFDILVADHLTHFSPRTLVYLIEQAGFKLEYVVSDCIKKEITLLASNINNNFSNDIQINSSEIIVEIRNNIIWLNGLINKAKLLSLNKDNFGIFGTSIGGTWLGSVLADKVKFFVDEDINRIGKNFMGKPVISPESVPPGSTVFLALAPLLAKSLFEKFSLSNDHIEYFLPD